MFTKLSRVLLFGACCWQLVASLPSTTQAASSGSSSGQLDVNFFYDTLKDDGSWFNTTEYGDVWQPYIAYKNDAWRPYTDGYWTYTDGGWMFVSYENFGWAVYHYGRWTQLKDIGWAWVPGTEWAPAWVTWRESKPGDAPADGQPAANVAATMTDTGDQAPANNPPPAPVSGSSGGSGAPVASENYIGWAPLPPDPEPVAYNSAYSYAYGPSVDIDYGIDPYDYAFTDVRYFGAPWIGGVIFDRDRGYYCAERSVNISNFYYNRQGDYRGFYNGGPRYDRFDGVTERPIPRLRINREQGRAAQEAIRAGRFNQINGNRANIVAPRFSQTNVRNGRVNFKNRGALPVSQVDRNGLVAPGDNGARDRARNAFRQQGESFRAQNPNSPSARRAARQAAGQSAGPGANPGIVTTPRARQEERAARQAARQESRQKGANAPNPSGGPNPANVAQTGSAQPANPAAAGRGTKAERRAARQQARQQAAPVARAGGDDRAGAGAARQQAREARRAARQGNAANARRAERQAAAPRVARAPRGGGEGRAVRAGGGGRGGGGGHASQTGGGGGGAARGGGGHGGGGHDGGKKH